MLEKKSFKNYLILLFILVSSIFLSIYFYKWYDTYDEINISGVSSYLNVIQYNELDNYLIENKDTIIYVYSLDSDELNGFEKKFIKLVKRYSLSGKILCLNVSNEIKSNKIYKEIESKYGINFPYIIIFEDGNIKSKFNIKDNNYDVDLLLKYFINEGVIND